MARSRPFPPITLRVEKPTFFIEAQTCYRKWDPSTPPDGGLLSTAEIPADREIENSHHFTAASSRRYEQDITYSTSTYIDTLRTYSTTRALPSHTRESLLDCIATIIDNKYGGAVVKRYLYELRIAQRRS